MKVILIWNHLNDSLFDVALANDDQVAEIEQELRRDLEQEADLGLILHVLTPSTLDNLLEAITDELNPEDTAP